MPGPPDRALARRSGLHDQAWQPRLRSMVVRRRRTGARRGTGLVVLSWAGIHRGAAGAVPTVPAPSALPVSGASRRSRRRSRPATAWGGNHSRHCFGLDYPVAASTRTELTVHRQAAGCGRRQGPSASGAGAQIRTGMATWPSRCVRYWRRVPLTTSRRWQRSGPDRRDRPHRCRLAGRADST